MFINDIVGVTGVSNLLLIFLVGFFSSFIANIAGGGGGMISLPMLIFLGLPPQIAVATKRFSSLGSETVTTLQFAFARKINFKHGMIIAVFTVIATVIGANILVSIDNDVLARILGVAILLALPFIFIKNNYGLKGLIKSKTQNYFGYLVYFLTDILDAFTGVIGGTLTTLILISLMGLTYLESNATKKIPGLTMAIVGTIIFAYTDMINYVDGIVLMLGMMFGGYLGVRTIIQRGSGLVKIAFFLIGVVSAVKLIFF